ncbi:MAG: hypothetical protein GY898_25485 [Proteobacteria bacterium]|nr:hypothetical protein [Pseudomonadota bacterium]
MPFRKCNNVIEEVSAIIDGEAGAIACARFFGHLAMCDQCTRYFEQFKEVRAAAAHVGPEDLPTDFDHVMEDVLARIAEESKG